MASALPKRILVSPLDWGLGHASRCIPLIDALLARKATVILASAGRAKSMLEKQYPNLEVRRLPAYAVRYPRHRFLIPKLLSQLPRLLSIIKEEQKMVSEWHADQPFDAIISDNRYGVRLDQVTSVMICHQLSPRLPSILSTFPKAMFSLHWRWLKSFDEIWVPDVPGTVNLSAALSHGYMSDPKVHFIGILSRFSHNIPPSRPNWIKPEVPDPKILMVLSGPEPQRSMLEASLISQVRYIEVPNYIWIVQGRAEEKKYSYVKPIMRISYLNQSELAWAFGKAKSIISRPGYSSLMDYAALGLKNLILIPTPGQTEQLYLAKRLKSQGLALYQDQSRLRIRMAFNQHNMYGGLKDPALKTSYLDETLDRLWKKIDQSGSMSC